jgi:prepilin-type N-terminal cleavage/methylation domain-containing protein
MKKEIDGLSKLLHCSKNPFYNVLLTARSSRFNPSLPQTMRKSETTSCPLAFTLIELLTVVSIMAVLSALALPALNSLGNGSNLSAAGRLVGNLVAIARSEAINQRTLVQLRLLTTNAGGTDDVTVHYRKLSLWKAVQSATGQQSYVQFSNWETLPGGVMVDPSGPDPTQNASPKYTFTPPGTYFLNSGLLNNSNGSGSGISYVAGTYNYAWVEFSPTGATTYPSGNATAYLLLTEAFMPSSQATAPVYTPANHPNWFQVSINSLTGMSEVVRP